jgi:hypothetical protein
VPIYFVSEVLAGSRKYYSEMENICYVEDPSVKTVVLESRMVNIIQGEDW